MSALPPTDQAIVTTATMMRTAAADEAPGVIELTPSTPLHLLAVRGSYSYAETFTGVRGWIKTADMAPVAEGGSTPSLPVIIRLY